MSKKYTHIKKKAAPDKGGMDVKMRPGSGINGIRFYTLKKIKEGTLYGQ